MTLPRLHQAQQTIKTQAKRFNVLRCGRRFGKNIVGHDLAIQAALSGQPVAWCAPSYPEIAEDWRELYGKLYGVIKASDKTERRIELITGGSIKMWSLDGRQSMRGNKYKRVIVNEAAKIAALEIEWNEVIRATLADLRGDAWFLSTPKGLNYFHALCNKPEVDSEWAHWHYTTYDNPHINRDEIDALKRELPESTFRQEIMADFVENGAYFQNVKACAVIEQPDRPDQHAGHTLVCGVDWGQSNDWTVITVGCRQCNRVVDWERFNQIEYHHQRARLLEMCKKWNVSYTLPERNSIGIPNIEELIRSGLYVAYGPDGALGFNTTAVTKPDLIEALHMALVRDNLLVPKDYADELLAYEREIRVDRPKFSAPSGKHDDRVMSLALCNRLMTTSTQIFV